MKNSIFPVKVVSVVIFLIILGASGCNSVNQENYAKIKIGMSYDKVVDILGKPESCDSLMSAKTCKWGKDPKTISIQFVGEKVVLRSASGL